MFIMNRLLLHSTVVTSVGSEHRLRVGYYCAFGLGAVSAVRLVPVTLTAVLVSYSSIC